MRFGIETLMARARFSATGRALGSEPCRARKPARAMFPRADKKDFNINALMDFQKIAFMWAGMQVGNEACMRESLWAAVRVVMTACGRVCPRFTNPACAHLCLRFLSHTESGSWGQAQRYGIALTCRHAGRSASGLVGKWTRGQVDSWASGRVGKWTRGQTDLLIRGLVDKGTLGQAGLWAKGLVGKRACGYEGLWVRGLVDMWARKLAFRLP